MYIVTKHLHYIPKTFHQRSCNMINVNVKVNISISASISDSITVTIDADVGLRLTARRLT